MSRRKVAELLFWKLVLSLVLGLLGPLGFSTGFVLANTTTSSSKATILLVGDSLSAEYGLKRGSGWAQLLQVELDKMPESSKLPRYQVQNASISGETTAGGRARIAGLLQQYRPKILILELGGNDALRGLDLSASEKNLTEMTQLAKQQGAKVLVLGMQIPPNFGKSYGERFSAIFQKLSQNEKTSIVPFFLEGVGDKLELFQSDRIHPNEKAQGRMMQNVWEKLRQML